MWGREHTGSQWSVGNLNEDMNSDETQCKGGRSKRAE